MKNYYNISYSKIVVMLTPIFLRNTMLTTMLVSIAQSLDILHSSFTSYAQSLVTRANSQVCYMCGMLNDEFDYLERRITVRPVEFSYFEYLLWKEYQPYPIQLWKEDEANYTPFLLSKDGQIGTRILDFEIVFPYGYTLSDSESRRLKNLLSQNKLASKKYRIVYE